MTSEEYNKLSKEEQKKVPFRQLPKGHQIGMVVLAAIIMFGAVSLIKNYTKDAGNKYKVTGLECYEVSKQFVEQRLKCPSTADFPALDYKYAQQDSSKYIIRSYVDSENGFGAKVRTNYIIVMKFNGGSATDPANWTVENLSMN